MSLYRVLGTLGPTLDDDATSQIEQQLVRYMVDDPVGGQRAFLPDRLARWRQAPEEPTSRPYRWAGYAEVRTRRAS